MKIAIEGCAHGDLDKIYATLQHIEHVENIKIDLLICCGDFQAVRNESDMQTIACPSKYREMKDFWKYYSGMVEAPYLTLFIGGNHEASAHLWELYHGGWVAPRIYFLGFAGVIWFGGLRIAGLSGIYKPQHYHSGYFENFPFSENDLRSIYHIREYEVNRLMKIKNDVDIFLSHDWPTGISSFGNLKKLLSRKPFLANEIKNGSFGSPAGERLLKHLKPEYYFSAHMHVKFSAVVDHGNDKTTKFLALDKCLPRRDFLQIVDFPDSEKEKKFYYDEEWLSISRACSPFFPRTRFPQRINFDTIDLGPHRNFVSDIFKNHDKPIPENFCMTSLPHPGNNRLENNLPEFKIHESTINPQTKQFCEMLGIDWSSYEKLGVKSEKRASNSYAESSVAQSSQPLKIEKDQNEIDIGVDDEDDDDENEG